MFQPFWKFILILGLVIFLILGAWLIFYSGRHSKVNRIPPSYQLIWSTDFSSSSELSGKIDNFRWLTSKSIPDTPLLDPDSTPLGHYNNSYPNLYILLSDKNHNHKKDHYNKYNYNKHGKDYYNEYNYNKHRKYHYNKYNYNKHGKYGKYKHGQLALSVIPDPIIVKDRKDKKCYPYSTSKIITTATFLTGLFIIKMKIPYTTNGIFPYIRLVDPQCNDNFIYIFRPLYHRKGCLYWSGNVNGHDSNTFRSKITSYDTTVIGLEWTMSSIKWYLNPVITYNGTCHGNLLQEIDWDQLCGEDINKYTLMKLEIGIEVSQSACDKYKVPKLDDNSNLDDNTLILEEINIYQK